MLILLQILIKFKIWKYCYIKYLYIFTYRIRDLDDFITKLWGIHQKVKNEGYTQNLSLGLFRSDYMVSIDEEVHDQPRIKQVEFNTIAASFAALSSRICELHRFLAQDFYHYTKDYHSFSISDLPENKSIQGIVSGLRTAFNQYTKSSSKANRTCIIFLVQESERNIFDQRHLEYALKKSDPPIPVFRLPFSEILEHTKIKNTVNRELLYFLPTDPIVVFEVAVAYFRAAYDPLDYPNQSAWDARFQIERSYAIKCPSILTQLAGSKKVQQVLVTSPVLNTFFPADESRLSNLKDTFTDIYPLDDSPTGLKAQELALDTILCQNYVLKPQREGGGNNIYRSAIPIFLKSLPKSKWKCYILMKIIKTPQVQNIILRNGNTERGGVVVELGIYGSCLWNNATKKILLNEETGYLLRTKGDQSEEGGVSAGYGCLDSCYLV